MLKYTVQLLKKRTIVVPTQVDKMRARLPNLNHCAVLFLSRAVVNLSWYDSISFVGNGDSIT